MKTLLLIFFSLFSLPILAQEVSNVQVRQENDELIVTFDISGSLHSCVASSPGSNPQGAGSGEDRVVRGGGWDNGPVHCRVASRSGYRPGDRSDDLGFRLAHPGK